MNTNENFELDTHALRPIKGRIDAAIAKVLP